MKEREWEEMSELDRRKERERLKERLQELEQSIAEKDRELEYFKKLAEKKQQDPQTSK